MQFHKHILIYLLRTHDSNALTQYLIAPIKYFIGIVYSRSLLDRGPGWFGVGGKKKERDNLRGSLNNHNSGSIIWVTIISVTITIQVL